MSTAHWRKQEATGAPDVCSQCGEMPSAMVKIGTTDGWCVDCLNEAADLPWTGCTGAMDCPMPWHEHGCYADIGQCSDPLDHQPALDRPAEQIAVMDESDWARKQLAVMGITERESQDEWFARSRRLLAEAFGKSEARMPKYDSNGRHVDLGPGT